MAVPYREWYLFNCRDFWRNSPDNSEDDVHWVESRLTYGKNGYLVVDASDYYEWKAVFRPVSDFEYDADNLDHLYQAEADIQVVQVSNSAASTHIHLHWGAQAWPASPNVWNLDTCNGQHYDGVNAWCAPGNIPFYPVGADWATNLRQLDLPLAPAIYTEYGCPYKNGLGPEVWMSKFNFENQGIIARMANPAPVAPVPADTNVLFNVLLTKLRFKYLNAVVNSLSRYSMPPAGGVAVVLTGLGFNNSDVELTDAAHNPNSSIPPAGGWNDGVYHIHFIGQQGQGTTVLHGHAGDFTIDSNTQITIPVMPALPEGTYAIYLLKDELNFGGGTIGFGSAGSYAGDWRAKDSGLLYKGSRIFFLSGVSGKKRPVIFTKWKFKSWAGSIFKYYAPIDIASSKVFYDGRILEMSSVSRASSGREGLFLCSDMTTSLANHDKEFSKLLAQYFLKNQIVEFFYGWADEPESWKTATQRLIVDDYSRAGVNFHVSLRDITTKYFKKKVPLYRCTEAEFPNIHKNCINNPKPEVLGIAALTTTGQGGAVEAIYIDTTTYKYLAARGSLHAVLAVYKDGVVQPPGSYAVSYGDDGATYITFTTDQEDAKITFDCEGYMFLPWNSANGFVQNPAYILAFHICFLMEVPLDFVDLDSIDALAQVFVLEAESETGFLVLQKENESENILKELLFTMGALQTFDAYGRFYVVRKGLSVLGTDLFVFAQIDTMAQPEHIYNLKDAINRCRYRWEFYPGQERFAQGDTLSRDTAISDFEQVLEAPDFIDFPWTLSSVWAAKRAEEELQKYGYGLPELTFELPIAWIDDLDVLTDFRLQDPFGTSRTGAGEFGRYCYVSSIDIDYLQARITIRAIDLNWLIKQYLMLGDENDLPAAWVNATDEERIFAYLCDEVTGRFPDGEPGKKLVDENMI